MFKKYFLFGWVRFWLFWRSSACSNTATILKTNFIVKILEQLFFRTTLESCFCYTSYIVVNMCEFYKTALAIQIIFLRKIGENKSRARCIIYSKLTVKTVEWCRKRKTPLFCFPFKPWTDIFLMLLMLALSKWCTIKKNISTFNSINRNANYKFQFSIQN